MSMIRKALSRFIENAQIKDQKKFEAKHQFYTKLSNFDLQIFSDLFQEEFEGEYCGKCAIYRSEDGIIMQFLNDDEDVDATFIMNDYDLKIVNIDFNSFLIEPNDIFSFWQGFLKMPFKNYNTRLKFHSKMNSRLLK